MIINITRRNLRLLSNISKTSALASFDFQAQDGLETASWFKWFCAFGNLMKHDARVFEITSPTKEIQSLFFFSSEIFFVHLTVAQKHVRAVSKHSFPFSFCDKFQLGSLRCKI